MATPPPPETPSPQPLNPGGPAPEFSPPSPDFDQPSPAMPAGDPGTMQPPEL